MGRMIVLVAGCMVLCFCRVNAQEAADPYLWLEEVDGQQALEWVEAKNEASMAVLKKHSDFESMYEKTLEIYDSDKRIAYPQIRGDYVYNFWKDRNNKRGLWRRTMLADYRNESPNWEPVLDIDALASAEDEKWVYKGATWLYPEYKRCIVRLSRGGGDAVVMREFDLETKAFVKDGFYVPEAKGGVSWKDLNTLYIGTDFGDGSTTESGYPRIAKLWKRGTPLEEAEIVFEGDIKDVGVSVGVTNTAERSYDLIRHSVAFFEREMYAIENGKQIKLDIPKDASLRAIFKGQLVVHLKSDWVIKDKTYDQGTLIGVDYDRLIAGDHQIDVIVAPDARSSIASVSRTRDLLLINMLVNVRSELYSFRFESAQWKKEKVKAPEFGSLSVGSPDDFSNRYFFNYNSFLIPSSLYFVSDEGEIERVKSLPEFFDASRLEVKQFEVMSSGDVQIPYFVVHDRDLVFDGTAPTLLYGYGGFEISMKPGYSATVGSNWLERGGVYVVANIRGGGEFGPGWHRAAQKENRQLAYDDFIAVGRDLVKRKITSSKHLGIRGASNGGLLVGVAFTQQPELFNAVVCAVPLLDMQRYNKLLAGASWMAEYGDPDKPEEWTYIQKYSPYHNVAKGVTYPKVFFYTSTRDDRVHPAHARKMVAKMEGLGHEVFYYENTEGGHAAATTNQQRAFLNTLSYAYLWRQLGE